MGIEDLSGNAGTYALAVELGDYRAAAREAVRAIRRLRRAGFVDAVWDVRFRGAFARRNKGAA